MDDEKQYWIKRHPCSHGLDEEAIGEILEEMELVSVEAGEEVQRAEDPVTCVQFILRGRLNYTLLDFRGRETEQGFISRGEQIGILAAAKQNGSL